MELNHSAKRPSLPEWLTPIFMTWLSIDYEFEDSHCKTLRLLNRTDELIEAVLSANPNAVIIVIY